jgi:glycosyltransferase involved in cell wall biosynthesis
VSADVTLVSPYPTPGQQSRSGVAWYTRALATALTGEGAQVRVVAPYEGPPGAGPDGRTVTEMDGGVRVDRCFGRGPGDPARAVTAALEERSPVVHLQHETFLYGGPASVPGVLYGLGRLRRAGRGPVVTMHQVVDPSTVDASFTDMHRVGVPPLLARTGLATIQWSVARLARRVVVHEQMFRQLIPNSVVLPLGGDAVASVDPAQAARSCELRAAAGAGPDTLLVLAFGFVAPYKGLDRALEAVQRSGSGVRLVVAGAEHPRLQGRGYLDGLRSAYPEVAHFTGYVPEEDVTPWFQAADAALLAYPRPFSSSGVLAHAVAHRVAALVSPGMAEVIGFPPSLALPVEPAAMGRRLAELAADRPRLADLADHTAALQVGRSWPEVARRHLDLYEEVTGAQRSSRRPVAV